MLHPSFDCCNPGQSATISSCADGFHWQLALSLKKELANIATQSNLVAANSCMYCCEKAGEWELALQGLSELWMFTMQPSPTSTSALVSATKNSNQWQLVVAILAASHCDQILLNSGITALGRWQLANLSLVSMRGRRFRSDKASFSAAMTACATEHEWTSTLALLGSLCMLVQPDAISYLDRTYLQFGHRGNKYHTAHSTMP